MEDGFSEVYTHAFDEDGVIELENPSDVNRKYMRTSLEEGLVAVLEKNKKHEALLAGDSIQVFEVGKVFTADEEVLVLGVASDKPALVDDAVSRLCSKLDLEAGDFTLKNNNKLAEVNLSEVEEKLSAPSSYDDLKSVSAAVTYEPFSKYPYVLRDIAVWTPAGTQREDVQDIIRSATNEWLATSNHFDTYKKEDKISYAFQLVFQSDEKTLSDEEVNEVMREVEKRLNKQDGFSVR